MKFETKELSMGIISFIAAACIAAGSFAWLLSEAISELRVGMSNIQGQIHVLTTREEKNTEILSARLTRVEENTEGLKEKVNSLEVKVNRVEEKVIGLEKNTEGLKEKVNSLEVEVRSTNEYLRKSENQDVPKDTSASDLTPDSP